MKVLLAYRCADEAADDPEFAALPPGLAWVAASVRAAGHEPVLANFSRLGWKDVERFLRDAQPALAGIACLTANRAASIRLARLVKRTIPGCVVAIGGPHASAIAPAMLRRVRELDFVVEGEGELAMSRASTALERGGLPAIAAVPGIALRGVAAGAGAVPDPDRLPRPAGALPTAAGLVPERDLRHVVASRARRGGPHVRTPTSIAAEMKELRDEVGVVDVRLIGPGLVADPGRLDEIAAAIVEEKVGSSWDVEAAIDDVLAPAGRDEAATLAAYRSAHAAGCRRARVTIDVEVEQASNAPRRLRDRLSEAGRLLRAGGLSPHLTLRFGRMDGVLDATELEKLRSFLRAFRPTEGELEVRGLLPDTKDWRDAAALEELDDAYWFEEDRQVLPLPEPRQIEIALAALEPTLREVTRSAQPGPRDLTTLERATGPTAWTHVDWGDYRAALGDGEEAERRYRLAAEDQPWNPFPWLRLAALFGRGRTADPGREEAALRQVLQRVARHERSRQRLDELRQRRSQRTPHRRRR